MAENNYGFGSLSDIVNYALYWKKSLEGHKYWNDTRDRWTDLTDPNILLILSQLVAPGSPSYGKDFEKAWKLNEYSELVNKLRILAKYYDRFGQDAPISLMVELISDDS